ncbi:MAG: hypothetical protein ACPG4T_12290 [Nannocystaceae bacterium]
MAGNTFDLPRILVLCGAATLLGPSGCADRFDRELLDQAARQLDCPSEQVQVDEQNIKPTVKAKRYQAKGCGRATEVEARCSVLGACAAYEPGHGDEAFPTGPAASTEFPGVPNGPQP